MNAKDAMLAELKARDPSRSLGQKFYTDPDFYRLDLETIFYRDWLFAGHDCEIPAPGDYFTLQIGDYPIIVLRGPDGSIRALHNSCRHRGSRLCAAPRGAVKRLVCPYHQWTYDLAGGLIRTRHMDAAVDKTQFGLKSVHCESVWRLHLRVRGARRAKFRALPGAGEPIFVAAQGRRQQGRLREHDR